MEDLYIEMLRYGREHLTHGVKLSETLGHLRELEPESPLLESQNSFHNTFFQVFTEIAGTASTGGLRHALNMEGYFNLLEHEELQQARQSSSNAMRIAIGAIIVSVIASAVSITVQLTS